MNDPLIARFAEACGSTGPLDLRVELADGGVLAEGMVHQPFTLVGRDDACDVTLTDEEVNPRHAWLQVVAGRVYAIDLGSRNGLVWPNGATGSAWLEPSIPVGLGPFRVALRNLPAANPPAPAWLEPLQSNPNAKLRPQVQLEFRNGKRAKDRWTVNRPITLIGRAEECKIHLNAEDISMYHCGLVLTPAGLWAVDLSGRGVVVNGERMRVAPLGPGAELWVGRFLVGCHYPAGVASRGSILTGSTSGPRSPAKGLAVPAEDEVPLGEQPPHDPLSGLPSSHIMADAFRALIAGPISSPILVSGGSGATPTPTPPSVPVPAPRASVESGRPSGVIGSQPLDAAPAAPVLKMLADIQSQLFDQFQQSMLMMAQVVGQMHREQTATLQHELGRIQELNVELAKLQGEVARLSLAQAVAAPAPRTGVSDRTPVPGSPGTAALGWEGDATDGDAAIQDWVMERIDTLQKERSSRWQKLVGLYAAKAEA